MPGKNRVIFPQEKVLLAGSGGANSCLMLSQVQEVFSLPSSVLAPGSSDPDRSNPSYEVAVDQYIKQNLTEEAAAGAVSQLSIHDSQHKQAGIRDTVRLADDAHS
ncbi:cytoplasmic tRNA 2-thiolation protein 2-like isoform X3 [Myxocyprinus asiaticus]|nr:cytoplasmic tRNA 2-thiolation protein 2-like isoform X3 [Myxocyprinus asiaticus]